MNKKEAIKRLDSLENEAKELRKIIEKEEEIDVFKVKTYSEVCKHLKEQELTSCDFSGEDGKKLLNFSKIKQLERFYNQGWKANWNNSNEYKYYPYFTKSSGGGSIGSYCYCVGVSFFGAVGFYKTSEIATFVGKTYKDIYTGLLD